MCEVHRSVASSRNIYLFQYCYYAEYWGEFFFFFSQENWLNCFWKSTCWLDSIINISQSYPPSLLSPPNHGGGSPLRTYEFVWAEVAKVSSLGLQLAKKSFNNKGTPPVSDAEQWASNAWISVSFSVKYGQEFSPRSSLRVVVIEEKKRGWEGGTGSRGT